jgi:hypothetical protein
VLKIRYELDERRGESDALQELPLIDQAQERLSR